MTADDQTPGPRWLEMTNAAYDKVMGFRLLVLLVADVMGVGVARSTSGAEPSEAGLAVAK
jgi:hypothetical protein